MTAAALAGRLALLALLSCGTDHAPAATAQDEPPPTAGGTAAATAPAQASRQDSVQDASQDPARDSASGRLAAARVAARSAAAQYAAALPAEAPMLRVNAVLNGGFEWVADATTDPPKYGAYWLGAFSATPGDPACLVVEDRPFRGGRSLRLTPQTGGVLQKLVADPRGTAQLTLALAVRCARDGALEITLEDGPGRRTTLVVTTERGLVVSGADGAPVAPRLAVEHPPADEGDPSWWRVELDLGALFAAEHGEAPLPRLQLRLACLGPPRALVDVDEVCAAVAWPAVQATELARDIEALVRRQLDVFYLPRESGGLQLVDPETGYVRVASYDVESGGSPKLAQSVSFHTIHTLLAAWLRECRRRGLADDVARWTPELERITATLLAHNFDADTGLPRTVTPGTLAPNDEAAMTVGAYVDFLLDARELVADEALREACLAQSRRIADTLLALQAEHDLPPETAPKVPDFVPQLGRFVGDTSNWFGHIPDRLTPKGAIETDKRFYTSWAILSGRTFWYELMRSPRAIARVAQLDPRESDLRGLHRAIGLYHRNWDAARYDLENDTDDHYGYLCDDLLETVKHSGGTLPDALAKVQEATDHRLERTAATAGDTLWVQGVRLGTACAGDSSRAMLGVLELYELPSELNPATSALPLYRDALLELARNDLQGRQLTNAQFTESFFKDWEMVCICFKGTYQGDCREHPPEYWHGDVGDTFGGPPTSPIDAQMAAYRVAGPALRPAVLGALGLMRDVTEATLRRPWGYLFGLDPAIARQYELPEKYTIGLSSQTLAGLGYAMAWMRLLPWLDTAPTPAAPRLAWVESPTVGRALHVVAPAGMVVALPHAAAPFPAPVSDRDARMLALDLLELTEAGGLGAAFRVTAGPNGEVHVPAAKLPFRGGTVQPLLLDPASGEVLVIGEPFHLDG
jgi:hypothetical protein